MLANSRPDTCRLDTGKVPVGDAHREQGLRLVLRRSQIEESVQRLAVRELTRLPGQVNRLVAVHAQVAQHEGGEILTAVAEEEQPVQLENLGPRQANPAHEPTHAPTAETRRVRGQYSLQMVGLRAPASTGDIPEHEPQLGPGQQAEDGAWRHCRAAFDERVPGKFRERHLNIPHLGVVQAVFANRRVLSCRKATHQPCQEPLTANRQPLNTSAEIALVAGQDVAVPVEHRLHEGKQIVGVVVRRRRTPGIKADVGRMMGRLRQSDRSGLYDMDIHTALTPLKATVGALALAMGMAVQAADPVGHWEGEIEIPNQPLVVKIDLRQDGGDWHGTIDIPAQGASTLPLDVAKVEQDAVEFSIRGVPGNPTFAGREANGVIRRVFSQGVAKLDFQLTRDEVPGPRRPQEPKPPFAYGIEETISPEVLNLIRDWILSVVP